jgi:putative heme-binding domain-containing protein
MKWVALLVLFGVSGATAMRAATLAGQSKEELVRRLGRENSWERRQAQRLLSETLTARDRNVVDQLEALAGAKARTMTPVPSLVTRVAALGVLHASGTLTEEVLNESARDEAVELRVWAARFTGERGDPSVPARERLLKLAADEDPSVRAAVAAALRQFTGGSLTVNTPAPSGATAVDWLPHFRELLARPSVVGDTYYPHIIWLAMEPRVAVAPPSFLPLLAANDNSVSAYCARRVMRRICDLTDPAARTRHLNAAMEWLGSLAAQPGLAEAALDGLIDAFKSKGQPPTVPLEPIFARLTPNPKLGDKARRLATLLGDTSASRALIAKINDSAATMEDRLKGIAAARETKDEGARVQLLQLFKSETNQAVLTEGLRALAVFGGDDIAYIITDAWKNFSLPTRRVASEVLVLRSKWSRALLAAVDQKVARPEDISATARRALAQSSDATVVDHASRVLGRYRASDADKLKLIAAKRAVALAGEPDLKNGHEVARRTCFVCHKLHGEGADVGPDLTGVGRSTLDALLHNVIDPNEVVGNGNEATEVELKDGTIISGRIVEDSPTRLKLVASGPVEHIFSRNEIAVEAGKSKIRTSALSLMPEGLEQIPDPDFRDLIWFLLNPPGDSRPMTPALRRELLGGETDPRPGNSSARDETGTSFRGKGATPGDGESVALWNPDWKVICPPFEGAPKKLPEFVGQRNVLMTHPPDRTTPAVLERAVSLPAGRGAVLRLRVAADERGDWELRVRANGELLHQQRITPEGPRWKAVAVDLTKLAGQTITLRLENFPNDWSFEFGYWADVELDLDTNRATR